MATAETAAKARLQGLKNKADKIGLPYPPDVTEDILRISLREYEDAMRAEARVATLEGAPAEGMAEVASAMKDIAKALRQDKEADTGGVVDEASVDPNDKLPYPRIFFAPSTFWILPMKKVGGQRVKYPYKKIVFSLEHGGKVLSGTQWNTQYLSTYKTESKREVAYMETHELYKKAFFNSSTEARNMSDKVVRELRFGQWLANLNTTSPTQLYEMAAQRDIPVSVGVSLPDLRAKLASALTDEEIERKAQLQKAAASVVQRSELLQPAQR